MKQRLAELVSYMDATRERLVATVREINPTFSGVRPRGDTWSVEENLAHLAMSEERIARLVADGVEWAKANGVGPATSDESVMSSLDQFSVAAPTTRRQAPPSVSPPEGRPIEESLAALASSRSRMKEALLAGEEIDLTRVKRPHPSFGELDLYQWALFVAQHEERHRKQIEKTMNEVTELAAECAPIV